MVFPPPPAGVVPQDNSGGLLARAGEQLANAPSDIFNDLLRLSYNVGVRLPDQKEAVQVPDVYDIAAPKTLGEGAVDVASGFVKALPLFMGGETAGEGLAESVGASKLLTQILKQGAGFGVSDLTKSPEQGAVGAGTGALIGAASETPWKVRLPLALAAGGVSAADALHQGSSGTGAAIQGGVNTALALFMGRRAGEVDSASVQPPTPEVATLQHDDFIGPREMVGPPATFSEVMKDFLPGGKNVPFNLRPTVSTPEGSLTRYVEPPAKPFSLDDGQQDLPFSSSMPSDPAPAPPRDNLQINLPMPPAGSLVRNPSITVEELDRFLHPSMPASDVDARPPIAPREPTPPRPPIPPREPRPPRPPSPAQDKVQPVVEPDGGTRTRPNSIVGPALVDEAGAPLIEGKIGENHAGLQIRGKIEKPEKDVELLNALINDEQHVFLDARGKYLSREAAAQVAREAGQVGSDVTTLHSENLREPGTFATSQPEGSLQYHYQLPEGGGQATKANLLEQMMSGREGFAESVQAAHETRSPEYTTPPAKPAPVSTGREGDVRFGPTEQTRARIEEQSRGQSSESQAAEAELKRKGRWNEISALREPIEERSTTPPPGSLVRNAAVTEEELRRAGFTPKEVATLQQEPPETRKDLLRSLWEKKATSPSSPETGAGEPIVKTTIRDETGQQTPVVGRVVRRDGNVATIRDIVTGEEHDVWSDKLKVADVSEAASGEPTEGSFGENWINTGEGGGKMRKSNFGEMGAVNADMMRFFARYGTTTIAGALGGAVIDHDHPLRGAIYGAVTMGLAAHFGPAIYLAFMEGHPDVMAAAGISKIPKAGEAVGKDAANVARALFADNVMSTRAVTKALETRGFDRLARYMQKEWVVDALQKRLSTQAFAAVHELFEATHKATVEIAKHPDTQVPVVNEAVMDYLVGKIDRPTMISTVTNRELINSIDAFKTALNAQQNIIARGLGNTALGKTIEASTEGYLTRAYKIFHDRKTFPTDAEIKAAAADPAVKDLIGAPSDQIAERMLNDYLFEIKAARGIYRGGNTPIAQRLDTVLSKTNKKDLPKSLRDMLGEYDTVQERLAATALKVKRAAMVSSYYNEMADAVDDHGLKYVLSTEELDAEQNRLQAIISHGVGPAKDEAQARLATLQSYIPAESSTTLGRLSGKWMPATFRDQLATWDSANRTFTSPMGRTLAQITNNVKYGKTVMSPFQLTRQVMNFPLLALMAKAMPSDIAAAMDVVSRRGANAAEILRLKKLGIWGGDIIQGQFQHDMAQLLMEGNLDKYLTESPIKKFQTAWEELYRAPDLGVRVAGFYRGETLAAKAGLTGDAAERYAVDYCNRYTINYATVPPGIQKLRQIPLVNQYLTFLYESTRITKNLMQDVIYRRDPHAAAVLATMAAAPFVAQHVLESQLSADDRQDWEQFKSLGPAYNRDNFRLVWGRDENGRFNYTDFTPLLIHDNWLKTVRAAMHGDWGALGAENPIIGWENTPLLNVATNQISGKDIHSGQMLTTIGDRLDSLRRDIAPTLLGTELDNFVRATTPNEDGGIGITNQRTGASSSLWGMLKSYLTATRSYTGDLNALKQREFNSVHDQMMNERGRLMAVLRTNSAQDVKQAAVDTYQARVKDMVATLQLKLNPPDSMAALSGK